MKNINENYLVDETGAVYSVPRLGTKGGILRPIVNAQGYHVVMLSPSRKPTRVHRHVAQAFIPNPLGLPFVNHKDGNKLNNHVDNLEWCTAKHNSQHAENMGVMYHPKGHDNKASKLDALAVRYIRHVYMPNHRKYGARALSRLFGTDKKAIKEAFNRESWKWLD